MQRKTVSLIEQFINTTSGLFISVLVLSYIINPLWGLHTNLFDSWGIAGIFFTASIIRGFTLRLFFNQFGHQTHFQSALEKVLDVGLGFLIATCIWMFIIVPVWGFETNIKDDIMINIIFFFFNFTRSFLWRRLFNYLTYRYTTIYY